MTNLKSDNIHIILSLVGVSMAPSYMDAWLKTSTKNKKQLMIVIVNQKGTSKLHKKGTREFSVT